MKKRFVYIVSYFITVFLLFVCQKPLFMLYNDAQAKGVEWSDYWLVMFHGASLDATTAGYLTIVPLLMILTSIWLKKFPLKNY